MPAQAWVWSYRRAISEARDALAGALRPIVAGTPTVDQVMRVAGDLGLHGDPYHVRVLLRRSARPVEIVNAIVAHHFHLTTNDVQLARRDVKTSYGGIEDFLSR